MKFKVLRVHEGDRRYFPGETREAREGDVAHLVGKCLQKIEDKPQNKAEKKPRNKAAK